jgi:Zn-dependent protease
VQFDWLFLQYSNVSDHYEFWAALAFLLSLQMTAFFLCMLPIPGMDGFGIISPYLPRRLSNVLDPVNRYAIFILVFIFFYDNPVRDAFWWLIDQFSVLLSVDSDLQYWGYVLFRFWER